MSTHEVRWECLTLNFLPATSEEQMWALEEVFQQPLKKIF